MDSTCIIPDRAARVFPVHTAVSNATNIQWMHDDYEVTDRHTFRYDARGNTVAKDAQNLNFDQANRLTSIDGKGTYTYDAAGRRVKKVTPAGTT